MAVSVAEFNEMKSDVKKHDEFINGNGKKGAKERLSLIEDNLFEIKEMLKWLRGAVTGLLLTVVGAVIVWLVLTGIPKIAGS